MMTRLVALDPPRPVLQGQQILIDGGMIAAVGKKINSAGLTILQRIDCSGKIVLPGLVNTHSHLIEDLARYLAYGDGEPHRRGNRYRSRIGLRRVSQKWWDSGG